MAIAPLVKVPRVFHSSSSVRYLFLHAYKAVLIDDFHVAGESSAGGLNREKAFALISAAYPQACAVMRGGREKIDLLKMPRPGSRSPGAL